MATSSPRIVASRDDMEKYKNCVEKQIFGETEEECVGKVSKNNKEKWHQHGSTLDVHQLPNTAVLVSRVLTSVLGISHQNLTKVLASSCEFLGVALPKYCFSSTGVVTREFAS